MARRRPDRRLVLPILLVGVLLPGKAAKAQDLGHRLLGTLGLDAGAQTEPGLYVGDRIVYYHANRARDRAGNLLPLEGFALDALANAIGVVGTIELPWANTYLTASLGLPLARLKVNRDNPEVRVDSFGLTDVYLKPLQVGWRASGFNVVVSYGLYIPTGRFRLEEQGRLSSGQFTHQLSAGGRVSFDRDKRWFFSVLATYELNTRKLGLDLTRGDTVQLQGGTGVRLARIVELGLAGYALWQVRDDRGADLPPALRGAREQAYGLGPEISVTLRAIGANLRLRYVWDLAARTRPEGRILVLGVSFTAWRSQRSKGDKP